MKKLSEQYPLKLKRNSVIEASNSEVEASWRGAEAVEVSTYTTFGSESFTSIKGIIEFLSDIS